MSLKVFEPYLNKISNEENRKQFEEVLQWILDTFPQLHPEIKWNQPMFMDHGTFIFAVTAAKNHMSFAPEFAGMEQFRERFVAEKVDHTKMLFKFTFKKGVDYTLLKDIISFNIADKEQTTSFWR